MRERTLVPDRRLLLSLCALALLLLALPAPGPARAGEKAATVRVLDYRLSGPYMHCNLTVYLVHGENRLRGRIPLALDEALRQKKVVVHETNNLNQVLVENVSDQEIFVQSGDVLKGGKQDRCVGSDLIVPPHSGKVSVTVFCVESARWQPRGTEDAAHFSTAVYQLPSLGLRYSGGQMGQSVGMLQIGQLGTPIGRVGLTHQFGQLGQLQQLGGLQLGMLGALGALGQPRPFDPMGTIHLAAPLQPSPPPAPRGQAEVKLTIDLPALGQACLDVVTGRQTVVGYQALVRCVLLLEIPSAEVLGQEAVWREVDELQAKLQRAVAGEVKSKLSESSLQLTLENENVRERAAQYVTKVQSSAAVDSDVVGCVIVVSGRVVSADVYGNAGLFKQQWPRILQAAAVEALAEFDANQQFEPMGADGAAEFLRYAAEGLGLPQDVSKTTRVVAHPRSRTLFYETVDPARKDVWVHRSYMPRGR
jgi:hypothetical protein